jgi:branched-chain amino acid transport system permease protein
MLQMMEKICKPKSLLTILVLAVAFLLPLFIRSQYILGILIMTLINIVLVMSVNIIEGYAGKISLCQAGFYGIGAYTTGILCVKFAWNAWAALPFAILIPAIVATAIGIPVLKLKGYYLAIATMGLQAIISLVILNWNSVTNGPNGIRGIPAPDSVLGLYIQSKLSYYYLYLFMLIIVILFCQSLLNSRYGRAFLSIKNDELASEAFAINTTYYRVLAFALSAGVAGMAGFMYALYFRYISVYSFGILKSIDAIAMLILGGAGTTSGAIAGTILLTTMPELLRFTEGYRNILIGVCITLVVLFMPSGIVGESRNLIDNFTARRQLEKATEVCDEN